MPSAPEQETGARGPSAQALVNAFQRRLKMITDEAVHLEAALSDANGHLAGQAIKIQELEAQLAPKPKRARKTKREPKK